MGKLGVVLSHVLLADLHCVVCCVQQVTCALPNLVDAPGGATLLSCGLVWVPSITSVSGVSSTWVPSAFRLFESVRKG